VITPKAENLITDEVIIKQIEYKGKSYQLIEGQDE